MQLTQPEKVKGIRYSVAVVLPSGTLDSEVSRRRDFHVAVDISSSLFSEASGYVSGDINRYHKATRGSSLEIRPHCNLS